MKYKYSSTTGAIQDATWTDDQVVRSLIEDSPSRIRPPGRSEHDEERWPHLTLTPDRVEELRKLNANLLVSIARMHQAIIVDGVGELVIVATPNSGDLALQDKLSFILAKKVRLITAPEKQVREAIERVFGADEQESVDSLICEFTSTDADQELSDVIAMRRPNPADRVARRAKNSVRTRDSMTNFRGYSDPAPTLQHRNPGMFFYTIDEGERVLRTTKDGQRDVLIGPKRVWRGWSRFERLDHHVAHPGQFLIVRFLDGTQQHLPGPVELWNDPRIHESIVCEDCLQLASKEAVVVYTRTTGESSGINRRIVHGPTLFTPQPGEWLHEFSWHASPGGHLGVQKIPNALKFHKLWLMPDQMYHDVPDVRTSDNAVLVIRLMVFFELTNIERMLESTRDPIGDFVNAATADVVEFTGRLMFEEFKQATGKLNELSTYRTLLSRAEQIGYRISNVVYRGYGAADSLQKMHDQAIEARTRLQLDRATEEQSQELEDYRLESQLKRASMRRHEQTSEIQHSLEMEEKKRTADLLHAQRQVDFERARRDADDQQREGSVRRQHQLQQEHFSALKNMGVDLTAFLTQNRADQVIELRGQRSSPHLHISRSGSTGSKETEAL